MDQTQAANLRLAKITHERAICLPADFVEEFARLKSNAHHTWAKAKEEDNFSIFRRLREDPRHDEEESGIFWLQRIPI